MNSLNIILYFHFRLHCSQKAVACRHYLTAFGYWSCGYSWSGREPQFEKHWSSVRYVANSEQRTTVTALNATWIMEVGAFVCLKLLIQNRFIRINLKRKCSILIMIYAPCASTRCHRDKWYASWCSLRDERCRTYPPLSNESLSMHMHWNFLL